MRRRGLDDVDVCFLVWREAARMLARHHAAVAAAVGPGWRGTAVLAENAPPAATSRAARALVATSYPDARRLVLRMPQNMGYARAMNLAVAACRGRYVALLNSDGTPEPEMLGRLAAALDARPDALWAAPAVHGPGERCEPPGPAYADDEVAGTALLVRREALLALGAFDPMYWFYSEDFDASRRAREAGHVLLRVPDAVFRHGKGGRSPGGRGLRELLFAATYQTLLLHREPRRRSALRRIAGIRARSFAEHRTDPSALAGLAAATLVLPASVAAAERRRRRPWDAQQLGRWLARHEPRVERVVLGERRPPQAEDDARAA